MIAIGRPGPTEYAPFYAGYLALTPEIDILRVLESQPVTVASVAGACPANREDYRYAPDKWSVREIMSHVIDVERVLGHRLFCVSRGEAAPLPGFDENEYVRQSRPVADSVAALAREFAAVREANLFVARRLDGRGSERMGTANGTPISVRALTFIMAGHVRHHLAVLATRYHVGADR